MSRRQNIGSPAASILRRLRQHRKTEPAWPEHLLQPHWPYLCFMETQFLSDLSGSASPPHSGSKKKMTTAQVEQWSRYAMELRERMGKTSWSRLSTSDCLRFECRRRPNPSEPFPCLLWLNFWAAPDRKKLPPSGSGRGKIKVDWVFVL